MRVLEKDKLFYYFDSENEAVYSVKDGESFWVNTPDCYNGQIKSESDLRTSIDSSIIDASVGPIRVETAEKGDILLLEIKDIKLNDYGIMLTNHGLGILGEKVEDVRTKIIKVDDKYAYFNEKIKIPLTPMVGVMGVSPASERKHCSVPGDFGGNMDTKEVAKGAKVYLPVNVDGANFGISDIHAAMGDGELSGTGIEISGSVLLKVGLIKGKSIQRPIIETEDSYYLIATNEDFDKAVKICCMDMVNLLKEKLNLDFEDSYMLMSAACDIGIGQLVNGVYTLKIRVKKKLLGDTLF